MPEMFPYVEDVEPIRLSGMDGPILQAPTYMPVTVEREKGSTKVIIELIGETLTLEVIEDPETVWRLFKEGVSAYRKHLREKIDEMKQIVAAADG
jgi:hypothetical protein